MSVASIRPHAKDDFTQSLGMMIALGSWSMMFGALFFLYFGARARAPMWPPPGVPRLPLALPTVDTLLLLVSSVALERGVRQLGRGRRTALAPWVGVAALLGAGFIGIQVLVWRDLWIHGLLPSGGVYASLFYGLTTVHAAHVVAGFVVLLVVLVRALQGAYTEHNVVRVRLAAMFWHFVDAVWVLMFVSIYLL